MADRFPLIANATTGKIEELASGDNLNLYDSSIVGAVNISANQFFGSLTGTATTSIFLSNAGNIVSGTLNPDRLSGLYPINITGTANTANYLYDAQNIVTGIIDPARLSGGYDINIGGNAFSADRLNNAANIIDGVINPGRLSGTYNISISGSAANATQSNFAISAGTATTSSVLTNASGILAGTISTQRLSGSYDINISGIAQTSVFSNYAFNAGIATQAINSGYASNAGIATNADYATAAGLANDVNGTYVTTGTLNVSGVSSVNTLQANSIVSPTIDADNITSDNYYGTGVALVGIVTQISAGIGLTFTSTQAGGKGIVNIGGRTDLIGKTIFVAQNGNDLNTGLVETNPKRSIKAAIAIAVPGDTVRVYPGSYIEDNPIVMPKNTSIYGSELRNCLVTPANPGLDLFQTNDGCHIVNVSFVGQPSENQAAVVAFKPLLGVATDRFFDGARMIRQNLEFISREAVGFLTSGYSGYAGTHREQDAGKLLYKNLDFIAAEAVGFITSTDYKNPVFVISDPNGNPINVSNCTDDVKDVIASVANDLLATGNYYSVGAALSYFTNGVLSHITGIDTNGYSIASATIAALNRAAGIATFVINNYPWGSVASGSQTNITNFIYDNVTGLSTITSVGHGVTTGDVIKLQNIEFSCSSGAGTTTIFPDGSIGYFFKVSKWNSDNQFEIIAGVSTLVHTYVSGGTVERYYNYQNSIAQTIDKSVIHVPFGCVGIANTITNLVGIITSAIGAGSTSSIPSRYRGIDLNTTTCARDVKLLWKAVCHDITRGGNSKCVGAAKSYFNSDGSLKAGLLRNPLEQQQTVKVLDYSYNIARSVINNCSWGSVISGSPKSVSGAVYDNTTGLTTITVLKHGLSKNDPVHLSGIGFTCESGPGIVTYPSGKYGYVFGVKRVVNENSFEVLVGPSTIPHTYSSGGVVKKYQNFQNKYTQVKDLSMQPDPVSGYNDAINSCANVVSAIHSCVGVITSIIGIGLSALNSPSNPTGIRTTYPGNAGLGITSVVAITTASYDNATGNTILSIPNYSIKKGDRIEIRDLKFSCSSGGGISTQAFPSGKYGYEFYVDRILDNGSLVVNTGVSSIPHTYIGGGFVVNRSFAISTATYDNTSGITTITAPGAYFKLNDIVNVQDLIFSCSSGGGPSTALYPSGNLGYDFKVIGIGTTTSTCIINTGVSTISHTYVSGGVIRPPYSTGTGNINKGPYIRNCTNFIPNSIGMKVDGFSAEPGDQDDNGVTGAMSVDSYTQYNQGGIGVSITNGAYCQLVSIFTICDNIAIYASGGGQCDINNSNASFGNYGLYAKGVGDNKSKSIYRYTGIAATTAAAETDTIVVSGVGTNRPYDGQALYFGELYYEVGKINVTNGGSGYVSPPRVVIDAPTGPNGITAEAIATIENGSVVSVDLISTGNQYLSNPNISFVGGGGSGAAATVTYLDPIYYNVESATLPDAGISTVVLTRNLNNTIGAGTTVYFSRLSLEIATTISFEWVGAGVDIASAKPGLGGVAIQDNEVVMEDGGKVVYTSTNQSGNFKIGDDLTINQLTGTISGRAFSQSLLNTVTPLIIALGR
jgi:hypothetical protein